MRDDPPLTLVFTTADARRFGLTQEQCEQRARSGRWRRLNKGVYCLTDTWDRAAPEARHLLRAVAVVKSCPSDDRCALSHVSAAVAHQLPVPLASLSTVTLTRPPGARRLVGPGRRIFRAAVPDDDLVGVDGVPVTSAARTVADCLRHLARRDAVAVADAALRRGLTEAAVREVLERQARWPYAGVAALALSLVDPRHESPLESRSAVVMAEHDIPAPIPQWEVLDASGGVVARVDFGWPDLGVVGEADGRAKYATADAGRVIEDEKDRHARVEALGLVVVRWGERHLHGPVPPLVPLLHAGFRRGDPAKFRGRAA